MDSKAPEQEREGKKESRRNRFLFRLRRRKPGKGVEKEAEVITSTPEATLEIRHFRFKKTLSNYLLLCITVLFLWLLAEAATAFLIPVAKKKAVTSAVYAKNLLPEPKPFSDYEETFEKRQLFKAYLGSEEMASLGRIGARKMLENFTLVGIISTGRNYRAIIRDARSKTTDIYDTGTEIAGFIIEDISPKNVLLKYGEETVELTRR